MKSIRQLACLAVMAAIGFLSTSAPAHAAFKMTLDDGNPADFKTITDNGSGDVNGAPGAITSIYTMGVFNVANVSSGVSTAASTFAELDLNTINISASGPGTHTLTITLTNTGYTQFGSGTLTNLVGGTLSSLGGSGSVTVQGWKDPSNTEFGMGSGTFTPGPQSFGLGAFSSTASVADTVTAPYSMTIRLTLTTNGGLLSFSADSDLRNVAVPELDPGSTASGLTLVSGSLLMLFGRRRRACA